MRSEWRRDIVGIVAVAGFVAVCLIVLNGGVIDQSMKELGLVIVGQLSMKFGTVVDYHYGSSAGSAAKDQTVAETAKAAATVVADTAKAAAEKASATQEQPCSSPKTNSGQ